MYFWSPKLESIFQRCHHCFLYTMVPSCHFITSPCNFVYLNTNTKSFGMSHHITYHVYTMCHHLFTTSYAWIIFEFLSNWFHQQVVMMLATEICKGDWDAHLLPGMWLTLSQRIHSAKRTRILHADSVKFGIAYPRILVQAAPCRRKAFHAAKREHRTIWCRQQKEGQDFYGRRFCDILLNILKELEHCRCQRRWMYHDCGPAGTRNAPSTATLYLPARLTYPHFVDHGTAGPGWYWREYRHPHVWKQNAVCLYW